MSSCFSAFVYYQKFVSSGSDLESIDLKKITITITRAALAIAFN